MAASALALLCFAICISAGAASRLASSTSGCPVVKGVAHPKRLPLQFNFTILPGEVDAINNAGTIAEGNRITTPPYSKYRTVKYPKANRTSINGINSKGVVVGTFTLTRAPYYTYGFVNNGSYGNRAGYKMYAHPNAAKPTKTSIYGTTFIGINDNNTVVGYYIDSKGTNRGFSFSLATEIWTPLVSAYSVDVIPAGINNLGVISGFVTCSNYNHNTYGFLYSKGVFSYYSLFASDATYPACINSKGYIVGTYQLPSGDLMAFVAVNVTTSPSVFTFNINPGTTIPFGINDWGTIIGNFYPTESPSYGFVGVKK